MEGFGTLLAGTGFIHLSFGKLKLGFIMGLISCCLLIPVFYHQNLYYLLTLQVFFAIVNTIGIYRNREQNYYD